MTTNFDEVKKSNMYIVVNICISPRPVQHCIIFKLIVLVCWSAALLLLCTVGALSSAVLPL